MTTKDIVLVRFVLLSFWVSGQPNILSDEYHTAYLHVICMVYMHACNSQLSGAERKYTIATAAAVALATEFFCATASASEQMKPAKKKGAEVSD